MPSDMPPSKHHQNADSAQPCPPRLPTHYSPDCSFGSPGCQQHRVWPRFCTSCPDNPPKCITIPAPPPNRGPPPNALLRQYPTRSTASTPDRPPPP
ncbi:hypothetical protein NMY22_g8573 [Coprinellus aureogranulatus]|nr:hypothetical protein NMY22_g8573 [Coprinellus aureogranulatus]